MPSRLILILGGCRSGKSSYALECASRFGPGGVFVATCPVLDGEMEERVRRHREERRGLGWDTLEEQVDLPGALAGCPAGATVLVDCLTLWVNNVMYRREVDGAAMPDEDEMAALAGRFADAAAARSGATIAVGNEVGLGVVSDNVLARRFRDLAGRVNQVLAKRADEVYFMVAGLPTRIK